MNPRDAIKISENYTAFRKMRDMLPEGHFALFHDGHIIATFERKERAEEMRKMIGAPGVWSIHEVADKPIKSTGNATGETGATGENDESGETDAKDWTNGVIIKKN